MKLTPKEAIEKLDAMHRQIIHGKNTFREIADVIRELQVEASLHQNIQRAAIDLPEGWTIQISVENHSGWVDLQTPDGNSVDVSGDRNLAEQVSEAISYAKEHDERT